MSLPFIIRDDDLCFFTDPKELADVYESIWEQFPISFAIVPFQKGTMAGHIPVKYWQTEKMFPLGENKDLVNFLKALFLEKKVDILMHGINHHYLIRNHRISPELVLKVNDFNNKLKDAKKYLENLFGIKINLFVPPSNTMSRAASKVLIKNNYNLLNLPGVRHNTRPLFSFKHQWGRIQRLYYYCRYKFDSPKPIKFKNHWEIGSHVLTPSVELDSLKKAFLYHYRHNLPFVLATHYWEHKCLLKYNPSKLQYDLFKEFISFVSNYDIAPMRARDLVL